MAGVQHAPPAGQGTHQAVRARTPLPTCRGLPTCLASDPRSVRLGVRRHKIAEELLITEDTYVKGLRSLVTLYIQPMRELLGTPEEVRARRHPTLVLGLLSRAAFFQTLDPLSSLYYRPR